jgi:hypothetical protein
MDDKQALTIVSALAYGANPITGEMFPSNSPYQAPEVIRALFAAARALETQLGVAGIQNSVAGGRSPPMKNLEQKMEGASDLKPSRPQTNAGRPWSADEDKQLLAAFGREQPLAEIARSHGRTVGGVRARLEKHGRLEPSSATRWAQNNSSVDQRDNVANAKRKEETARRDRSA